MLTVECKQPFINAEGVSYSAVSILLSFTQILLSECNICNQMKLFMWLKYTESNKFMWIKVSKRLTRQRLSFNWSVWFWNFRYILFPKRSNHLWNLTTSLKIPHWTLWQKGKPRAKTDDTGICKQDSFSHIWASLHEVYVIYEV